MITTSADWERPVPFRWSRPRGLDVEEKQVRLVDRRTGEVLASTTAFQRGPGLADFFGLPQACPKTSEPRSRLDHLLESFPPAKRQWP